MTDETTTPAPAETPAETSQVEDTAPAFGEASIDPIEAAMGEEYDRLTAESSEEETPSDAPQEQTEDPAAKAAEETDQPSDKAGETEKPGQADQSIDPPNSWSAEGKAKWASIPLEAQKIIAEREEQSHKTITSQGQYVAALKPVTDLLQNSPYRDQNPTEMLTKLVQAQAYIDRSPEEGLKWLADSYGVDLRSLAGVTQDQDGFEDTFRDPRVDHVSKQLETTQRELQAANQQIQELGGFVSSQQQKALEAEQAEMSTAIDKFAEGKPYVEELFQDILNEVTFLKSTNPKAAHKDVLEKAYERALNNSPTFKEKVAQEKAEKDRQEAEAKLAKARKTQSTNVRSNVSPGRQVADSWDDDRAWSQAYDSIAAG